MTNEPNKITECKVYIQSIPFDKPLDEWVKAQAKDSSLLLAHALDGVIWGQIKDGELITSDRVAPKISPELRVETLQQLRLFNEHYEVKLWRVGDKWQAIRISETEPPLSAPKPEVIPAAYVEGDEQQLLWGTHAKPLAHGFIELEDGAQGLRHVIPPFKGSQDLNGDLGSRSKQTKQLTRVYLKVRHYLTEDALGVNTITISRLLGLGVAIYPQPKSQS